MQRRCAGARILGVRRRAGVSWGSRARRKIPRGGLNGVGLGLPRCSDRRHPGEPRPAQRALARNLPPDRRKLPPHRPARRIAQHPPPPPPPAPPPFSSTAHAPSPPPP